MYLLDTNHCSHLLNSHPKVVQKLEELGDTLVATCVIVRGELIFMAFRSEQKAIKIARNARNQIYTYQWGTVAPNLFVTASIGVALASSRQPIDVVIERTILGSRNAKREGGNQVKLSPLIGIPRTKSYKHPVDYLDTYDS